MPAISVKAADRLAMRSRPLGSPVMHQTWEKLLFMHWPVSPRDIRPLIPAPLELETFEGQAWIAITPFRLTHLRPIPGPEIPGLNSFYELNMRTYVQRDGVPGIWFFSLDASKIIPVLGARLFYSLPYNKADMEMNDTGSTILFKSHRKGEIPGDFEAAWRVGNSFRSADVGSLAFFLVERYCLYSADSTSLFRARIYHAPWHLQEVELVSFRSSLHSSQGLSEPVREPLLHFAERQDVEVWAPEKVL